MISKNTKTVFVILIAFTVTFVGSASARWNGGLEGGTVLRDGESFQRVRGYLMENERPLNHYLYVQWYRGGADGLEVGYKPTYWLSENVFAFARVG